MKKQELIEQYEEDLQELASVITSLDREDESWEPLNCEMAFKRLFLFDLQQLK